MSPNLHPHPHGALGAVTGMGACGDVVCVDSGIDSGITPGLVVVDANRPAAFIAAAARQLPKQPGAAH